jgi:hypothetical protein
MSSGNFGTLLHLLFVTLADIDNQKQTVPILICMIPFIGPCRYFPTLSWQIDEDS